MDYELKEDSDGFDGEKEAIQSNQSSPQNKISEEIECLNLS